MRRCFTVVVLSILALASCSRDLPPSPRTMPLAPPVDTSPPTTCAPLHWVDDAASGFVVPLDIDGRSYPFQLDTGTGGTSLYGTELARSRGWPLETSGDREIVRLSGFFARRPFSNARFLVMPDMPGDRIAGTLGMDMLLDRVAVLDFPARRVCLYDRVPDDLERRTVFAPTALDQDHRFLVEADLAGMHYKRLLYDTGSSQFAVVGSFASWKRWTGLDDESGATHHVSGTAWGREIHMVGAAAVGALTIGPFSVERPVAFYCKENPDPYRDWPVPPDAVVGNAPFLDTIVILDARPVRPRFGVVR